MCNRGGIFLVGFIIGDAAMFAILECCVPPPGLTFGWHILRRHHWLLLGHRIPLDGPVLQKYLVERVSQRLQGSFPDFWLQVAFPDDDAVPPH